MGHPPAFHTARLVYRAYTDSDSSLLERLYADPETVALGSANLNVPTSPAHHLETGKKITEDVLMNIVVTLPLSTSEPTKPGVAIGWVVLGSKAQALSIHRKCGFSAMFLPEYQGKGYGQEAVEWLVAVAFERANLHKIEIGCFANNARARRCYEKVGFQREGVLRSTFWNSSEWIDDCRYGLLADDWRAAQKAKEDGAV